jgi:hypothetical protein
MIPATLHAARQALPAWVVWAPLPAIPIAAALGGVALALAGRGVRRLEPGAHWTERARHVSVARRALLFATVFGVLATAPLGIGGPVSVGAGYGHLVALVLAVATGLAIFFRFEDRNAERHSTASRLRSSALPAILGVALATGGVFFGLFEAHERPDCGCATAEPAALRAVAVDGGATSLACWAG